jgi:hypothetical protein
MSSGALLGSSGLPASPARYPRSIILAASYPPRDYKSKADSHEIALAVKALAGAVFQQGWTLVFGGHPAVSPLILMIAREYGQKDRVVIYQSMYFFNHINPSTKALTGEKFGEITFVPNDPSETPPGPSDPVNPTLCPRSLTSMRRQMIEHPGVTGLVLIGGDTGLRQELDLFAQIHRTLPILAIGGPGGIAKELVRETRAIGLPPRLADALENSRNYLTLSTGIMRYLASR